DVAKIVVLLFSVARTASAPSVKLVVSELPRERLKPESMYPPHAPTSSCTSFERMDLMESLARATPPTSRLSPEVEILPVTMRPSLLVTYNGCSLETVFTADHFSVISPA